MDISFISPVSALMPFTSIPFFNEIIDLDFRSDPNKWKKANVMFPFICKLLVSIDSNQIPE